MEKPPSKRLRKAKRSAAAHQSTEMEAAAADDMDMPPRMREAMERRKGKQPAPAASDCCDAPAAPTKKVVPANDPKSVSARLAKIEKGKGPSAQNPLLGLGQSEKSGSSSVCRRKGGG